MIARYGTELRMQARQPVHEEGTMNVSLTGRRGYGDACTVFLERPLRRRSRRRAVGLSRSRASSGPALNAGSETPAAL